MLVGEPTFHSWGRCTIALTNMNSDLRSNPSSGLCINLYHLYYVDPLFCNLGCNVDPLFRTLGCNHVDPLFRTLGCNHVDPLFRTLGCNHVDPLFCILGCNQWTNYDKCCRIVYLSDCSSDGIACNTHALSPLTCKLYTVCSSKGIIGVPLPLLIAECISTRLAALEALSTSLTVICINLE